jgi:hypothetical protein
MFVALQANKNTGDRNIRRGSADAAKRIAFCSAVNAGRTSGEVSEIAMRDISSNYKTGPSFRSTLVF